MEAVCHLYKGDFEGLVLALRVVVECTVTLVG